MEYQRLLGRAVEYKGVRTADEKKRSVSGPIIPRYPTPVPLP
jgi:hypothetical protein